MFRVDSLRKLQSGCMLFDDSKNVYYLTGFTGEGCLLVTPASAVIITDFRYVEQCFLYLLGLVYITSPFQYVFVKIQL